MAREQAKERTKDVDRQHPLNRNITNIKPKSERDIEGRRKQMANKLSGDSEVATVSAWTYSIYEVHFVLDQPRK
jgi:hypothetical protein